MNNHFFSDDRPTSLSEIVWILGGGQFGHRAAERLRKASPTADIVVIDNGQTSSFHNDIESIQADGVAWLVENFTPDSAVTRITPATSPPDW